MLARQKNGLHGARKFCTRACPPLETLVTRDNNCAYLRELLAYTHATPLQTRKKTNRTTTDDKHYLTTRDNV